jgi:conjugal transfer pilus assembly protein TraU
MLKNFRLSSFVFLYVFIFGFSTEASAIACGGRVTNPITDICWLCMFPIHIGSIDIRMPGQIDNHDPSPPLICACPAPPPVFLRIGIGVSFWEPARVAEVVRTPMCSPMLGGVVLGTLPVPAGTHHEGDGEKGDAFYHIHWFQYPVLSWLGMAISRGACSVDEPFDLAYLSELDPLWDDDELAFILNPEAILFANPVAQAACVADSISASTTMFGLDSLFWCSGSQGSVYPLDGNHASHVSGIDSSLAIVHKHIFKMHRLLLAQDTSTNAAICGPVPQPIMRKNQYKQQMMYPVPQNVLGLGFGVPSTIWASGREFPYKGEDFSYLIWRKRTCCAY